MKAEARRSVIPRLRSVGDLDRLATQLTHHESSPRFHAGLDAIALDGMRALDARLGEPLRGLPLVHVAGSKGKGSVCLLLESLLQRQGFRTGVTMSPHLEHWTERIRLHGANIDGEEMVRLANDVLDQVNAISGERPTFFEVLTAMAFLGFGRERLDVGVVEVGIGGRLDATNIIAPAVCVITSIECEHAAVLGRTLREIAREKAGIIKPGVLCVSGVPSASAAGEVIQNRCREVGAPLWRWGHEFRVRRSAEGVIHLSLPDGTRWHLPLGEVSPFQGRAAALAAVARRALQATGALAGPPEAGIQEFGVAALPGRAERVRIDPAVYRDGAHTPHSLREIARFVREREGQPPVVILGLQRDKRIRACLQALHSHIGPLIATHVPGGRSADPRDLATEGLRLGLQAEVAETLREAFERALVQARPGQPIVVTGSFWLAGWVRTLLDGGTA